MGSGALMEPSLLGLTLLSGACWCGLYGLLLRRFRDRRLTVHLVSLCHSLLVVLIILLCKLVEGRGLLWLDFSRPTRPHEELIICLSLGYFLYDTAAMKKSLATSPMVLHHAGSCIALAEVLRRKEAGSSVLLVILLLEGSNPLLHLRRILQHYGLDRGRPYFILELVYLFLFIFFRFGLAGKVSYDIFTGRTDCQPIHVCITVFFDTVSCIFLCVICIYIGKEYFNKCKHIKIMK